MEYFQPTTPLEINMCLTIDTNKQQIEDGRGGKEACCCYCYHIISYTGTALVMALVDIINSKMFLKLPTTWHFIFIVFLIVWIFHFFIIL